MVMSVLLSAPIETAMTAMVCIKTELLDTFVNRFIKLKSPFCPGQ